MITTFEPTPKVQTYLIAFLVSDYSYLHKQISGLTPQKVYAPAEAIHDDEAHFGVDAGIKILTDLENYLLTDYSLPKMDQVSVPLKGGAMENWGLVRKNPSLEFNSKFIIDFI